MLLAAGRGTRLGSAAEGHPKGMVVIEGRPVLEHNVRWLRDHGVRELVINLHYRGDEIASYFEDGSRWGVRISYSREIELLGTAGALAPVCQLFRAELFLVLYADNLITCDIANLRVLHRRESSDITVALYWREDVRSSGVAELDGSDRITAFHEKPADRTAGGWVNAGLLLCEPKVLDLLPASGPSDFGRDVLPTAIRTGFNVVGYRMKTSERLYWLDTPDDLKRTRRELRARPT
jgi:NDP-sugar pyrophosphorylase family protein